MPPPSFGQPLRPVLAGLCPLRFRRPRGRYRSRYGPARCETGDSTRCEVGFGCPETVAEPLRRLYNRPQVGSHYVLNEECTVGTRPLPIGALYYARDASRDAAQQRQVALRTHLHNSCAFFFSTRIRANGCKRRSVTTSTRRPNRSWTSINNAPCAQPVLPGGRVTNRSTSLCSSTSPRTVEPNTLTSAGLVSCRLERFGRAEQTRALDQGIHPSDALQQIAASPTQCSQPTDNPERTANCTPAGAAPTARMAINSALAALADQSHQPDRGPTPTAVQRSSPDSVALQCVAFNHESPSHGPQSYFDALEIGSLSEIRESRNCGRTQT